MLSISAGRIVVDDSVGFHFYNNNPVSAECSRLNDSVLQRSHHHESLWVVVIEIIRVEFVSPKSQVKAVEGLGTKTGFGKIMNEILSSEPVCWTARLLPDLGCR